MAIKLAPYSVKAYNIAKFSENKMHDDTIAKQFGFSGGLVPGVDVFAYMSHPPLQLWGRAFLERGQMEARFLKPVYDGDMATVTAAEANGQVDIEIESRGIVCGTAHARLVDVAPKFAVDQFRLAAVPDHDQRSEIDASSFIAGSWLNTRPHVVLPDIQAQYLKDICEDDPLYLRDGIIPCGTLLRFANWALSHNVRLGPWIHVGSMLQQLHLAKVGERITLRAKVTANYEKKGHRLVDLEALIIANDKTPVAHVLHTAIYQPRPAEAAA